MQSSKDAENLTANENQSPNMEEKTDEKKEANQPTQVEKVAPEESKEKKESESSSEEEEKLTPAEQKLQDKIGEILAEYYLSGFQTLAAKKFIKDKVGNPKNQDVERLREWLFMRINGRKMPEKYHPR